LFIFVEKSENTHLTRVVTQWWWERVGVGEEEPTKNYIKLVLASQLGQGIMASTVRVSRGISFLKLVENSVLSFSGQIYNLVWTWFNTAHWLMYTQRLIWHLSRLPPTQQTESQ